MEDIPYLLPSEVARLVYGQLKDFKCDEVAEKFLRVNPHMKECLELKENKRTFTTKAHNLSLEEIFDQFLRMNELLLNTVNNETRSEKKFYDPIAALKFLMGLNEPTTLEHESSDESKCDAGDNDDASNVPMDIGSSSERICNPLTYPKKLDLLYNVELSNFPPNSDTNNPPRPRGKVKVLKPKLKTLPVAGKSINRCNDAFQSSSKENTTSIECENHETNDDNHENQISVPFLTNDSDTYSQSKSQISTYAPTSKNDGIIQSGSTLLDVNSFQTSLDDENHEIIATTKPENVKSSATKPVNSNDDETCKEIVTRSTRNRKTKKTTSNDDNVLNGGESVDDIEVIKEKYIQERIIENVEFAEVLANNINKTLHETPSEQIDRACVELASKMADEKVQTDLHSLIDEILGNNNLSEDKLEEHSMSKDLGQIVTKTTENVKLMEISPQDLSQTNLRNYVMNNSDVIESTESEIVLCNSSTTNMVQFYSLDATNPYYNNTIVIENNPNTNKNPATVKYQPGNRLPRILPRIAPKPNSRKVSNNETNDVSFPGTTKGVRSSKRIKKS